MIVEPSLAQYNNERGFIFKIGEECNLNSNNGYFIIHWDCYPPDPFLLFAALRHSWISEFICYFDLNYWSDSCWNDIRFSKRPFALHEHQTSIYIHSYLYMDIGCEWNGRYKYTIIPFHASLDQPRHWVRSCNGRRNAEMNQRVVGAGKNGKNGKILYICHWKFIEKLILPNKFS